MLNKIANMDVEDIDMMPSQKNNKKGDIDINYTTMQSDSGDMTFCISSYVKEAIKVKFIFLCK